MIPAEPDQSETGLSGTKVQPPPISCIGMMQRRAASLSGRPLLLLLAAGVLAAGDARLLNASYDVTREFYQQYNPLFIAHWKAETGQTVTINQSHGGSSAQARAVIDGLQADVVSFNQALDIDLIADKAQLIPHDWPQRLPEHSVPFTSTILFLVRRGNPKGIADWADLIKPDIGVIIPNPKTSGNGRYSYLAAWAAARANGDDASARAYVKALFAHVLVLDAGGRGATTTFATRGIGDVLLTFENEIHLIQQEFPAEGFTAVVPSLSILAENPVAVVETVAAKHGITDLAHAYLAYLFSDAGQELAAAHWFRPCNRTLLSRHADRFPALPLVTIDQAFGGWAQAQRHFAPGGTFDELVASP
jgi:sulfate transport system substrate-binding protein